MFFNKTTIAVGRSPQSRGDRQMEKKLVIVFAMVALVAGSAVAATVYTNRSNWEAAVGAYQEEDFDDLVLDPGISVVSDMGYITAGGLWWDRLIPTPNPTTTTWTFSQPIYGFGGNWDLAGPGGPGTKIEMYRNGTYVGTISNAMAGGFWGFTNGPFDTILLTSNPLPGYKWETYEMDNMVYAPDITPPTIVKIAANPRILWPPNHKMVKVTLKVFCKDDWDPKPVCRIVKVTSNEPENGLGDGDTGPDWEFSGKPGDYRLKLRAERAGGGTGRIYTIHVECTDDAGNSSVATVQVIVPHDMG